MPGQLDFGDSGSNGELEGHYDDDIDDYAEAEQSIIDQLQAELAACRKRAKITEAAYCKLSSDYDYLSSQAFSLVVAPSRLPNSSLSREAGQAAAVAIAGAVRARTCATTGSDIPPSVLILRRSSPSNDAKSRDFDHGFNGHPDVLSVEAEGVDKLKSAMDKFYPSIHVLQLYILMPSAVLDGNDPFVSTLAHIIVSAIESAASASNASPHTYIKTQSSSSTTSSPTAFTHGSIGSGRHRSSTASSSFSNSTAATIVPCQSIIDNIRRNLTLLVDVAMSTITSSAISQIMAHVKQCVITQLEESGIITADIENMDFGNIFPVHTYVTAPTDAAVLADSRQPALSNMQDLTISEPLPASETHLTSKVEDVVPLVLEQASVSSSTATAPLASGSAWSQIVRNGKKKIVAGESTTNISASTSLPLLSPRRSPTLSLSSIPTATGEAEDGLATPTASSMSRIKSGSSNGSSAATKSGHKASPSNTTSPHVLVYRDTLASSTSKIGHDATRAHTSVHKRAASQPASYTTVGMPAKVTIIGKDMQSVQAPLQPVNLDPNVSLCKQKKPPCNQFYLTKRGCTNPKCNYSHSYKLSEKQLDEMRSGAARTACVYRKQGQPCMSGEECVFGHKCPQGSKCKSGNKCHFPASMH